MSECTRCLIEPKSHSFIEIGSIGEISIIYSCPAECLDYKESTESFSYYSAHLNHLKGRDWIWIVDCSNMKIKHACSLGLTKKLVHLIQEEHGSRFRKILILDPTAWIHGCITMVKPFLKKDFLKKIHMITAGPLDIYTELKEFGAADSVVKWLLDKKQRSL